MPSFLSISVSHFSNTLPGFIPSVARILGIIAAHMPTAGILLLRVMFFYQAPRPGATIHKGEKIHVGNDIQELWAFRFRRLVQSGQQ